MKTEIRITGQIGGNSILLNSISTYESKYEKTRFYGYLIIFPTKAKAKKALWEAFKKLRADEPQSAIEGVISYSKYGSMRYDASIAEIL